MQQHGGGEGTAEGYFLHWSEDGHQRAAHDNHQPGCQRLQGNDRYHKQFFIILFKLATFGY